MRKRGISMYCSECGAEVSNDSLFCDQCGVPCEPIEEPIPQVIEESEELIEADIENDLDDAYEDYDDKDDGDTSVPVRAYLDSEKEFLRIAISLTVAAIGSFILMVVLVLSSRR